MRQVALSLAIIVLALPLLAASPAQAAARTWVSATGDDANPCSRTAPCQTFAGALARTTPGGEINCLDPGQFGRVTVTFSLTISCAAGTAGILVSSGDTAIAINAATTDVVTLRGLDVDGQGSADVGIFIGTARAVHVEKCSFRNFRGFGSSAGIFTRLSATVFLFVSDTVISDNSNGVSFTSSGGFKVASLKNVTITGSTSNGMQLNNSNVYANVTRSIISGNGGGAVVTNASSTTANIDRSTIANNAVALNAAVSGSTIRVSGNNIYNNTTGFSIAGGAFIQSDSTNNTGGSNGGIGVPNAALTKN